MVSILSLVVAALAVFIGPMISLWICRRELDASMAIANKSLTAPMRQAWINSLRDLVAELSSGLFHLSFADDPNKSDEDLRTLVLVQNKILLMLNSREADHQQLEKLISGALDALHATLGSGNDRPTELSMRLVEIRELSRTILKREWDRVKEPLVAGNT